MQFDQLQNKLEALEQMALVSQLNEAELEVIAGGVGSPAGQSSSPPSYLKNPQNLPLSASPFYSQF
ncbi:MAG: hypothetical protein N4J56_004364 [Chroococcidiopsis sp. SAG 2025]|uniref:hypothetical protein n=1 Tax=Chroococcidiopsis sp. SAG 2025 TaxID=171389 RepID=UPI002936E584|nr:hypothetical protein [Chroococcidiopsis sp. SAG 2025]MDV2994710.1 hypothetical protein [Chroococcidiopsis sp. SAG 2025]